MSFNEKSIRKLEKILEGKIKENFLKIENAIGKKN